MLGSNNAYVGIATFTGCAFFNRLAANSLPPKRAYRPPPTLPFNSIKALKRQTEMLARQNASLNQRYDLSDRPLHG